MVMIAAPMLGVMAGVLTTVAGMGGGVVLLLVLSLMMDPAQALAATAPALMLGNLHRALSYRHEIDLGVGLPFVAGALPAALMGGWVTSFIPGDVIRGVMLAMMLLSLARALSRTPWRAPTRVIVPAGALVGWLTAAGGGAGVLAAPLLLGAGLTGNAYVGTAAFTGATMHVGRVVAYGVGGLFDPATVGLGAVLAVTVLLGNELGRKLRGHIPAPTARRLEIGAVVVGTGLAAVGVLG